MINNCLCVYVNFGCHQQLFKQLKGGEKKSFLYFFIVLITASLVIIFDIDSSQKRYVQSLQYFILNVCINTIYQIGNLNNYTA